MLYGADVVLPIIDFGQDSAWRPIDVDTATRVAGLDPGGWWVTARWLFIALGWILASVFVAAFTSVVQTALRPSAARTRLAECYGGSSISFGVDGGLRRCPQG